MQNLNFNDTMYLYLDLPNIPDSWKGTAPGWYSVPAITLTSKDQPVYPNKILAYVAKVIVQDSTQTVRKFAGVPAKVGTRVPNEAMDRIREKAISKTNSDCAGLRMQPVTTESVEPLGFSSLEDYAEFWSKFTPYITARREYLDLFYLFRALGPLPMPGQPKGHVQHEEIEQQVPNCPDC